MIEQFFLNVEISGVAVVVTETMETFYSVSFIVRDSGVIPAPSSELVSVARLTFNKYPVQGYSVDNARYVSALFRDEKLLRWQIQYVPSFN